MYVENLVWPHPQRPEATEVSPSSVLAELARSETADATGDQRIAAAQTASRVIRQALLWDEELPNVHYDGAQPYESLDRSQVTNCCGYTTVLSEALERYNVDHYIGFANHHAFTLVPTEDKRALWYIDAMAPSLNQQLTRHTSSVSAGRLQQKAQADGRAAFVLNSDNLASAKGWLVEDLVNHRSHWVLNASDSDRALYTLNVTRDDSWSRRRDRYTKLIGMMYTQSVGRTVLKHHVQFEAASTRHDDEAALENLEVLAGIMPDVDITHSHKHIKRLVTSLASKGDYQSAQRAAELYMTSFDVSDDPRVHILHGDLLRSIVLAGRQTAPQEIADQALQQYSAGHQKSRHARYVSQGKLRRMQQIADRLTPVDNAPVVA